LRKILGIVSVVVFIFVANVFANSKDLAKKLAINAGDKAAKQWERIFTSAEKLKELGVDKLPENDKRALKNYLMAHAADSDHPSVPGE
jgi:hypothetical protein